MNVDFEHQRRKKVIRYIYRKYGGMRAVLTAVIIPSKADTIGIFQIESLA
nr:hypothetical protein [Janthinobacterium lividum]